MEVGIKIIKKYKYESLDKDSININMYNFIYINTKICNGSWDEFGIKYVMEGGIKIV